VKDGEAENVFTFGQSRVQSRYTPDEGRIKHVTKLYRVEIVNRLLRVTLQKTIDGLTPSLLKVAVGNHFFVIKLLRVT
ncbi:hypothetical protein SARC_16794, partial [Sphaeroforma arctica JP610]